VNIILFEERELNNPGAGRLAKRDPRAVHLIKVLRKKPGDRFAAGVTGARRGAGTITGVDRDGTVRFTLDLDEDPPPRLPLHIGVGLNRPIQLRRILRGLSNLGCAAISVFGTDSGEKSYGNSRLLEDGGAAAALLEGAGHAAAPAENPQECRRFSGGCPRGKSSRRQGRRRAGSGRLPPLLRGGGQH